MPSLTFHGAAGTVTGSKYLLEARGDRLLVDCGMFQGLKVLRELNWQPPPFDVRSLRWVVLTHAHIDHAGWLPRLHKSGFRGTIFATAATAELCELMLMDSARLQEEDADFLNRKGASRHKPALPLYDEKDAEQVLKLFETVPYERWKKLSPSLSFRFICAGHLLGSAMVEVRLANAKGAVLQSGWEDEEAANRGPLERVASGDAGEPAPSGAGAHAGEATAAHQVRVDAGASGEGVVEPESIDLSEATPGTVTTATAVLPAPDPAVLKTPGFTTILFSGDIGRFNAPLAPDPKPPVPCDVLIVESTYGNRPHHEGDVREALATIAERTFARRGILLVPSFAVGRAQQVMFVFRELFESGRLKRVPIHLDSPMAVDASKIYSEHRRELDPSGEGPNRWGPLYGPEVVFHRSPAESKKLNTFEGPGVIISSSGMITGGRILHHLMRRLPDPRNTVLLVGYQAVGTRGRALAEGATYLRFHGEQVEVRAEVATLHGLSGHSDAAELMRWTQTLDRPRMIFLTHGEPDAALALAEQFDKERGWKATIPALHQSFEI